MRKTTIILLITLTSLFTAEANLLQTIYFQPADQPAPSLKQIDDIRTIMLKTQAFYRTEMERHGYGSKTFKIEKDENYKIIVHIIEGKHTLKEYHDLNLILDELPEKFQRFWVKKRILVLFLGGSKLVRNKGGIALKVCGGNKCGYIAHLPAANKKSVLALTAHEIGHTFGLWHHTTKPTPFKSYIMNPFIKVNKGDSNHLNNQLLTANETKILNTHPFFSTQPLSIPLSKFTITTWGTLKSK